MTALAKARKVRIVPAVDELPPVNVDGNDDFALRKEKKLRKGLLKGKLGTLVMEADQPASFRLPAQDSVDPGRTTTMATVLLRFDPADRGAQPPRLSNLQSKLKINTFFATTARKTFPARSDSMLETSTGFHTESLDLSSRCMANVEWTLFEPDAPTPDQTLRRSSSVVSGPLVPPSASAHYSNGSFYAARILVPIDLPQGKAYPPSFHSCLISRTYTLSLQLSTNSSPSLSGGLDLRVPVQISASPSLRHDDARPSISSSIGSDGMLEDSEEENELGVNEFFEPRTINVPEDEYIGSSRLRGSDAGLEHGGARASSGNADLRRRDSAVAGNVLPEYSLFAPGARDRRVGVPAF